MRRNGRYIHTDVEMLFTKLKFEEQILLVFTPGKKKKSKLHKTTYEQGFKMNTYLLLSLKINTTQNEDNFLLGGVGGTSWTLSLIT